MPIATLSDGVDVRGGQMKEVADREVGRKADGKRHHIAALFSLIY